MFVRFIFLPRCTRFGYSISIALDPVTSAMLEMEEHQPVIGRSVQPSRTVERRAVRQIVRGTFACSCAPSCRSRCSSRLRSAGAAIAVLGAVQRRHDKQTETFSSPIRERTKSQHSLVSSAAESRNAIREDISCTCDVNPASVAEYGSIFPPEPSACLLPVKAT